MALIAVTSFPDVYNHGLQSFDEWSRELQAHNFHRFKTVPLDKNVEVVNPDRMSP